MSSNQCTLMCKDHRKIWGYVRILMNEAGFHRTTLVGFVATWFPMSSILLRLMMCSASVFGNVKHLILRDSMPPQKRFQNIWCMVWHSGQKQGKFHCVNLRYIKEASERICTCLKKVRMKWTSEFQSWKVRDLLLRQWLWIHPWKLT